MRDATEIIVVLDKSGSMYDIKADTIGGFNAFLEKQQHLPGEANLTLVLFDTTYTVHAARPIKDVPPLTGNTYDPEGSTALLDALAHAIIGTRRRLEDMPEYDRPHKVIVAVITDGHDNSSVEHTRWQVQKMIRHMEDTCNWVFIYLGSNVDAFDQAEMLGICKDMAVNFASSADGVFSALEATTEAVSSYREEGCAGLLCSGWQDRVKS